MTPGFASPGPTINATAFLPSRRLGQGQWKATKPCPRWRARYRWVDRSTTYGIRSIRNLAKGEPDVPRELPSTSQQHLRCIASDSARRGRRPRGRATPRAGMGCAQPVRHDAAIPPRTTSQEPEPEPDAQHGSRIAPGRGRGGRRRTRHGRAAAVFTQVAPREALPGRLQAKRVGSVFPATPPQPGQLADPSRPARLRRAFRGAGAGPVRPRPAAQGPASTDDCDKRINWYVSPCSLRGILHGPVSRGSHLHAPGTGLFVTSGAALATSGPASLLLAFAAAGISMYCTCQALGELAVVFPIAGSFSSWATRFLDASWGFALGWK